jgi:phage terminase large subunit-like protein
LEVAFQSVPVVAGLDLSARHDLTALVYAAQYENEWHVRCEFFAPADGVSDRSVRDRVPYDLWARDGYLTLTPGKSVDYEFVAVRLAELCSDYDVTGIRFDRWRMDVLQAELTRLGATLPMVPHGQGFRDISPALDTLEAELMNGRIRHGNNPILTWCASNSIVDADPAGNRKLNKMKSTGRIDGMVALAMALAGGLASQESYVSGRLMIL